MKLEDDQFYWVKTVRDELQVVYCWINDYDEPELLSTGCSGTHYQEEFEIIGKIEKPEME